MVTRQRCWFLVRLKRMLGGGVADRVIADVKLLGNKHRKVRAWTLVKAGLT